MINDVKEINAKFWVSNPDCLGLSSEELAPEGTAKWLANILLAADKLSSKGARLVDSNELDNPNASLPEVHIKINISDSMGMLDVTQWTSPIPEDADVFVEIVSD